ncbi:MAG: hypothetical protein ABI300_12055 [Rhodanobacter sp.]
MFRSIVLSATLALAAAAAGMVFAQASAPAPPGSAPLAAQPADTEPVGVKPGDRGCIRQTGSRIRVTDGQCLPLPGRSYSGEDLNRTGAPNTARALQMLDPSIRVGR